MTEKISKNNIKICLITEHFPPHVGGVEIVFEEYAKRLSQRGFKIKVITSNSGGLSGVIKRDGFEIYYLPCKTLFSHPLLLLSQIKDHVQWADIIHTTTYTAALPAIKACKKYSKPCVLMVHETLGSKWFKIEKNPVLALGFLLFEFYVLKKDYTIWQTISLATQKDLLKYQIPKEKIRLIYHGIDYIAWNKDVKEKKLSTLLDFNESDKIFLYNGRPGQTKGIFLLLESIKKIRENLPKEFKFGFIISKEPKKERKKFEKLITKYKLETLVKITNSLPYQELPGYRKNAFAFIVPSLTEGFGFNTAETAALDVPLIVSDAGSLPEVASGKVLFFKNGNSDDLAEKILKATKGEFDNIPAKKFNWNKSIDKIEDIYKELILKQK